MWQLINIASRERDSCRRRRFFFGSSTASTQGTRVPVNDSRHFSSQKSEIVIPVLPSRLTFRSRSEQNETNVYCLLQYLVPSRTNFAYEQLRSSPKKRIRDTGNSKLSAREIDPLLSWCGLRRRRKTAERCLAFRKQASSHSSIVNERKQRDCRRPSVGFAESGNSRCFSKPADEESPSWIGEIRSNVPRRSSHKMLNFFAKITF